MTADKPGLLTVLSKTAARLRARGAGELLTEIRKGVHGAVSSDDELIFFERAAGGEAPVRDDLGFIELTSGMGALYARDIGTDSASSFTARLTTWTRCYGVVRGDRLVHASWVTLSRAWTSELRTFIYPPAGDAYVYESFTRAEGRGQGIYPFALLNIAEGLGREGVARVWVAAEADNIPSVKAITKSGFEETFRINMRRRWGRLKIDLPTHPEATAFLNPRERA